MAQNVPADRATGLHGSAAHAELFQTNCWPSMLTQPTITTLPVRTRGSGSRISFYQMKTEF